MAFDICAQAFSLYIESIYIEKEDTSMYITRFLEIHLQSFYYDYIDFTFGQKSIHYNYIITIDHYYHNTRGLFWA